jgi:hypothetical protein
MRSPTARAAALSSCLVLVATACLFSTTPPARQEPGGEPPPDEHEAVVLGKVTFRDRTDQHTSNATGHPVRLVWYGNDRDQDGHDDIFLVDVVRSDNKATYRATCTLKNIRGVEVQAMVCSYDFDVAECCIATQPCSDCPPLWLGPRHISISLGARVQQDLQVWCDHAP